MKDYFIHYHPNHGVRIDSNQRRHRAVCSCGWKGDIRYTTKDASGDIGRHLADLAIESVMEEST